MCAADQRHIRIAGAHNVRDLGGYATTDGGRTRWRAVLRADSLHRLQAAEVESLVGEGVSTVIDLRHSDELERAPNPLRQHAGVTYINVPLFEGLNLSGGSQGGGDALYDLYVAALAARGDAIRQVVTAIAEAGDGAVLFHCTAGKDRTGLIAALLLALVDVDHRQVVDDYALTKQQIAPLIEELAADAEARGVDMARFLPLLACEAETMAATLSHIAEHHGSALDYLLAAGLDGAHVDRLKARLVERPQAPAKG